MKDAFSSQAICSTRPSRPGAWHHWRFLLGNQPARLLGREALPSPARQSGGLSHFNLLKPHTRYQTQRRYCEGGWSREERGGGRGVLQKKQGRETGSASNRALWDQYACLSLQTPHTMIFCSSKSRKTKCSILTWVRAPHRACISGFQWCSDNYLIPSLKKLLFPVRAELTAHRHKALHSVPVWVCACACLYVWPCACLAAICFGPPPHLATSPKSLLKIIALK